ncbi:MAG: MmcQ/YjbR family DNA-binding protein [Bacteroidetes bacterium]|nr:MmcQ/YjbR family DNA-binding protein [Bacteroidota bacterium]
MNAEGFATLALSFPGTEQVPHFDRVGFRVAGKRMFATYLERDHTCNIFLSVSEQKSFCSLDSKNIYPVPNKWGEKGATTFVLKNLPVEIVTEALRTAYDATRQKRKD